jgi:uncharacterized protein YbjT (DUF2867 family)
MAQAQRDDLVRPARRIVPRFTVDHVVAVAALGVPEALVEGGARAIGVASQLLGRSGIALLVFPRLEQPQGVGDRRDSIYCTFDARSQPVR